MIIKLNKNKTYLNQIIVSKKTHLTNKTIQILYKIHYSHKKQPYIKQASHLNNIIRPNTNIIY